jgi:hypothetical protein
VAAALSARPGHGGQRLQLICRISEFKTICFKALLSSSSTNYQIKP